jgi:filamentous hemagglutinin
MVAGATATGAAGQVADAGVLLAAANGGGAAGTVDAYNRQLHPNEVAFLQDKARVKRYADYIKEKTGTTLTEEQAQLALSRYGAAMEDEKWAQVNGRDGNTEAFIKQEASAAKLSYIDGAGNKHVGFQTTAAEYKDETINLRALFDAYSPGNSIATYLGANLNSKGQTNAAQRFRQGQQLGYQDAGKEANLANDAWNVAKGVLGLPKYVYQSLSSDEVGPLDSERMTEYHQALLKTQGRYEEAGYLYEKDWATTQRLMVVGLPLTELGGQAIWKAGSAAKTSILGRGAAKEAAQAIEKARVENNRRRDDDQQYVNNTAPKDVPEVVTRNDNDFTATVNYKGNPKAHVDADGNLISANPGGTGTVADHVRGSNPQNTSYISTTDPTSTNAPKDFGKQQIEINTRDLQRDINSGDVRDGKVVPPQKVQAELQEKVDKAQARYDANPTKKNEKRLEDATRDLSSAKRDGECLISPCIPAPYIKWPNGVAPKPNVAPPPAKH